jgi:hypothetical protein
MRVPSGEKSGSPSRAPRFVRARSAPDSTSSTCTRPVSVSPEAADDVRTNAISRPFGDQAGVETARLVAALQSPDVRRRAAPPSASTIQRWAGRGEDVTR